MEFNQYLEYLGLSKAEFARQIGVTPDTVSRWRGNPPKLVMLYLRERYERTEDVRNLRRWISGHMGSEMEIYYGGQS